MSAALPESDQRSELVKVTELMGLWSQSPLFGLMMLRNKGSFPGGSDRKESACNAGDQGSVPGLGRSSGEGNGNPDSVPAWEFMDRGAWQGNKELDTTHFQERKEDSLSHFVELDIFQNPLFDLCFTSPRLSSRGLRQPSLKRWTGNTRAVQLPVCRGHLQLSSPELLLTLGQGV